MIVDLYLPSPGQSLLAALSVWGNKIGERLHRLLLPHGDHLVERAVFNEMATVVDKPGINTFKRFMAYKGALLMVNG